jgi:hypothetical protein
MTANIAGVNQGAATLARQRSFPPKSELGKQEGATER